MDRPSRLPRLLQVLRTARAELPIRRPVHDETDAHSRTSRGQCHQSTRGGAADPHCSFRLKVSSVPLGFGTRVSVRRTPRGHGPITRYVARERQGSGNKSEGASENNGRREQRTQGVLATRNPVSLKTLPEACPWRADERQSPSPLFQLPPRNTRTVPLAGPRGSITAPLG